MLDLEQELAAVLARLDELGIPYALCGGMAMSVWGFPRATVDIDLLVTKDAVERIVDGVADLGYTMRARRMTFSGGAIVIERVSKIDPQLGDTLMLDMLVVTPAVQDVWDDRREMRWDRGRITVVSREGLIKLKSYRGSGTDRDDIAKLRGET